MNDRGIDNQFTSNISPEQLRQLQNIAALTGNNLGLLGNLNNLINPMALQNLLNPILANPMAAGSTPPNINDSTSALGQQQQQQNSRSSLPPTPASQQQQPRGGVQVNLNQPQNLSFRRRGRRPKAGPSGNSLIPSSSDVSAGIAGNSGPSGVNSNQLDNQLRLSQTIRLLRQQQQQQTQERNELIHQEFTQRLHQQLQQIVQQSQRQQQPHPSHAPLGNEPASLSIRQQQSLQNSLQPGPVPGADQQKRRRGRPPLSAPSTSAPAGTSAIDYNYLNVLAAVKSQQERESKMQQDRQRELRQQQERERQREMRMAQERAERQREIRIQQERERQRLEIERQRKAQHRLALQDIDRERRRQHMIMVRNLDAYKRNEEREKTVTAMMAERTKQAERRMHQKRLEVELIKDIRKPVDDMMLKNQKPLATLNRIPGLKLPGKAFADLLMSYEFLYNFGETVGLELKEIPDINTLQLGLLNLNTWAEDQFISVLHHLCMFAIKDSRFPYSGSLKEIENLERTNEGLSQMLHFYLQVATHSAKTDIEHEYRLYKLIEQKYFLSLNATQKAEMLAFICNELLCSHTVTKQMEDTIENVAKLRKDKWVLENELRKYRVIKTKRELKEEAELKAKEAAALAIDANGETEKTEEEKLNDSKDQIKLEIKREEVDKTNKSSLTNGSSLIESTTTKRENDAETSLNQNNANDLDDLEPEMTNDELIKKIENLTRQYNKTSNKLERAINSMRACPLGQDRYRRRYWVLPQVGGVFVEGMESSEPEELENNKFTEDEMIEYEKEEQILNEQTTNETEPTPEDPDYKMEIKDEKDDDDIEIKEVAGIKDDDEAMDIKDEEVVDANDMKDESKIDAIENGEPEGDKNMSETACDDVNAVQVPTIPWFSILPRTTCDFSRQIPENIEPVEVGDDDQKKVREEDSSEGKAELSSEELRAMRHEICPVLAKKLEDLEAQQYEAPRKIHPQYQCGWWRITDSQQLKSMLSVLHERGTRERILHKHLTKHFQYACNSCKNTTVDFEITSYDRQLAGKNYGAPVPHTDDDSADDLKDGEEDEEEEEEEVEELDEVTGDDGSIQHSAIVPSKKSKRKKTSRSARSRRLRARAAARKKVENSKNKLAQR